MLGALISGGLSLASGLLGGLGKQSSEKKQEEQLRQQRAEEKAAAVNYNARTTRNALLMNKLVRKRADRAAKVPLVEETTGEGNLQKLVADAEASGFNPLTVLRAGGQGFYASSRKTTTGHNAMEAALAGQHLPQLMTEVGQTSVQTARTGTDVLTSGLAAGVSGFQSGLEQEWQNQHALNLVQAQLQGAQRQGAYSGSRFGYVPSAVGAGGRVTSNGSGVLRSANATLNGNPMLLSPQQIGATQVSNEETLGGGFCLGSFGCVELDPNVSTGDHMETLLGEAAGFIWPFISVPLHAQYNLTKAGVGGPRVMGEAARRAIISYAKDAYSKSGITGLNATRGVYGEPLDMQAW